MSLECAWPLDTKVKHAKIQVGSKSNIKYPLQLHRFLNIGVQALSQTSIAILQVFEY